MLLDFSHHISLNTCSSLHLLSGRLVLEDVVHLFQGSAVGLRDEEVNPDQGNGTKDGEEDICAETNVLNHGWSDQANDEVVSPVGHGSVSTTLGTEGAGEDLGWHSPWDRTPVKMLATARIRSG